MGLPMEGSGARLGRADERAPERREEPILRFSIALRRGRLREALAAVDWELVDLEHASVGRVRLVLSEILSRSARAGDIDIVISVLSETIRIELSGPSLALPEDLATTTGTFPPWLLADIAERWGIDRRKAGPAMWVLLERG
jgi:hypothetical protein